MALLNKLFSSKKTTKNKQENVSEKPFTFTKDQLRLVLFKECDFRGRKLLFDSTTVKKIPLEASQDKHDSNETINKFVEVTGNYGYLYTKPPADCNQLAEMVFGLVAMSFRGTYFKIHNLDNVEEPHHLMFTKVFPSPRQPKRRISSNSSHSCNRNSTQSLEHSIKLDDSGVSSTTSFSEHLSVHSTASDTILVCRKPRSSIPLDVPTKTSNSAQNASDPGFRGYQSYSSFNNSPRSLPLWEYVEPHGTSLSFSTGSLFKRFLRSTNTSLDRSISSLNGSTDDCGAKTTRYSSKLGLAFIIKLDPHLKESQIHFLMEHVALLNSMLWRSRCLIETAYNQPNCFLSKMVDVSEQAQHWFFNLLSGPTISQNMWTVLSSGSNCDNDSSITDLSDGSCRSELSKSSSYCVFEEKSNSNNQLSPGQLDKSEFNFFSISRFIRGEWDSLYKKKPTSNLDKEAIAGKFIEEFCELLETIDVKDTNFFISTLMTAVLTHHLGWVTTVLPMSKDVDFSKFKNPYSPLWGQLSDMYGAVGHPTKMAQTVITGTNKKELITKILNTITYFIRCCELERKYLFRKDVEAENNTVDAICQQNSCIPKENYKKYEDHLREMMDNQFIDKTKLKGEIFKENIELNTFTCNKNENRVIKPKIGLKKAKTCAKSLAELAESSSEETEIVSKSSLRRVSTGGDLQENQPSENSVTDNNKNVIFVLGENEKLVGLKKDNTSSKEEIDTNTSHPKRPNFLDLIFKKYETFEEEFAKSSFKDEDFTATEDTESLIKPSTSWSSLQDATKTKSSIRPKAKNPTTKTKQKSIEAGCSSLDKTHMGRSQSVPPPEPSVKIEEVKAKYKYSGIKFNLHQYPQVVTNYMRSKNLEMANLSLLDKAMKISDIACDEVGCLDFSRFDENSEAMEALQTPGNASELEFTSDLTSEAPQGRNAIESTDSKMFLKQHIPNTTTNKDICEEKAPRKLSFNCPQFAKGDEWEHNQTITDMKTIELPMPGSVSEVVNVQPIPYVSTLMKGTSNNYIPDMVLQGITAPKVDWEFKLKSDLALASQHSLLDQPIEEAVAVVANTDNWEVQLLSSHTYIIDKGSCGIRIGMSRLVSNMLESLLQMWKLHLPPQYCILYIEQRLQELCVRSRALAQLLLTTEFCSMEFLTTTLNLEVNDVPLLMAVASTHSPQVTEKYGLSFQ